jgi:MoaA/NifB/PqqE/SkfB family radical SAM enzyme
VSRALRLAGAFLRRRPIWCSWQVTRRCASYCMFCEHRLEGMDEELDLAGCTRVSEALASSSGALVVSLTGGEPFLRQDLADVVRIVARHHYPLLTTHGWLVTREKARAVWEAGLEGATVRLQHALADRHDEASGLPRSHARALEAVAAFAGERTGSQRVNVKVRVWSAADLDGLEELLASTAALGASVTVEPGFPLGGREAGLSSRLMAVKRRHRNLRSSARYLARFDEAVASGVGGCQAGRAFVNVDHRGRVSKCVEFQAEGDRVGDLSRERWSDVAPRLRAVSAANTCRSCWYASRGEVEGLYSARGLMEALPVLMRS